MNNGTYNSSIHSQPTTTQRIIYFTPNLVRAVSGSATVNFGATNIRVIQKADVQQYALRTNNLYQFSLNLEEAQA